MHEECLKKFIIQHRCELVPGCARLGLTSALTHACKSQSGCRTEFVRSLHLLNHAKAGSGGGPGSAELQHPIVRAGMGVGWSGKVTVPVRTIGGPS